MLIVRIEHPIVGFDAWKAAFDRDPVGRERSGVRRYRIVRPVDDPNYVAIDLEFDDLERAESFRGAIETMWRGAQAKAVLGPGAPRLRMLEEVETQELTPTGLA